MASDGSLHSGGIYADSVEGVGVRGGQMGDTNPLFSVFDKNAFLSESDPKM